MPVVSGQEYPAPLINSIVRQWQLIIGKVREGKVR